MIKKISLVLFIALALLITPNFSFGATSAEIQAQIQAIMAQIKALQQQLVQLQAQQVGTVQWCHTFNTNLRIGDQNDEVTNLDRALIKEGFLNSDEVFQDARTVLNFDESTAAAVTGFQEKYRSEILTPVGLKYGTGYVGKSTRAKLNQLYGCGITPSPVSAGYLEIEPSSAFIVVGGSASMQAMYQPTMPKCPEGFACPQGTPAPRIPVVAEWTSSNPSVASIDIIGSCAAIGCPVPTNVLIKGISNGVADINALYNSPYGMDKVLTATAKVIVGSGSTAPSITIISPNGGEVWQVGSKQKISWTGPPSLSNARIIIKSTKLVAGGEGAGGNVPAFSLVIADGLASSGSYDWTILSNISTGSYVIWVDGYDSNVRNYISDSSNAPFSIVSSGNAAGASASSNQYSASISESD